MNTATLPCRRLVSIVFALAAFSTISAAVAGDCTKCTADALCEPHRTVEAVLIAEVKSKLEVANVESMGSLLDRLFSGEEDHASVPSPTLARFLAENFERAERRIYTANPEDLMHPPLDKEVAEGVQMKVAFAALERSKHPEIERSLIGALERAGAFIEFPKSDPAASKPPPPLGQGSSVKDIEKYLQVTNVQFGKLGRWIFAHDVACEAIRILAARPSAAGRVAATSYYKRAADKSAGGLPGLAAQLLKFGCAETHQVVIDSLRGHKGGLEPEKVKEGDKLVERKTWGAALHETLSADAAKRGLPVPEVRRGDRLVDVWRKWYAANHEKLAPAAAEPAKE